MENLQTTNLRRKALDSAAALHFGQKRRDGRPYHTHLTAVAEIAERIATQYDITHKPFLDTLYAVSVLHDTIEDTMITKQDIERAFNNHIAQAVEDLSRRHGETYFDFIMRIADSREPLTTIVKMADLQHNMSDLQEGSMKDKYRFAYNVLLKTITR
jgi:(p)ppGpp synthase/HD superfamily hydrolase